MNEPTPLAFHRRRIEAMSLALGAWARCDHAACRRAGACRRAADVFPACLLPILRDVNESLGAFAAAVPGVPPRAAPREEFVSAQIASLNKRIAAVLEAQVEEIEQAAAKKRAV